MTLKAGTWDGTSGTLVRSPRNLLVGFELSGKPEDPEADLEILIAVYDPDNIDCTPNTPPFNIPYTGVYGAGWCERYRGTASDLQANYGEATMNAAAFNEPPWGSFDSSGAPLTDPPPPDGQIQPFFFAEAALNLTELGVKPGCPGFGSVHAKSRSSLEVTADLKDLAEPLALTISCGLSGYKYNDANGSGTVPPDEDPSPDVGLPDRTINLYMWDAASSAYVWHDSTTTSDGSDGDPLGYYEFLGLSDGKYMVEEACESGWEQTFPTATTGCGSGVHEDIVIDVSNRYAENQNFGNAQGSIAIHKVDGDGEFLSGAGFTFDVWPFAEGDPEEIYDGGSYDQAIGDDGVVCLDGVALGTYVITESTVPSGYGGDEPQTVAVDSSSTCANRLAADPDAYDATFVNTPLSEIEVIFRSLVAGATKATITCWAPDEYPDGDPMIFDSGTADEDETLTNLLLGLYICEIDIDP